MRSIYRLANASSNMPILATTILQILFVSLKGDALAFLAGIWATGGKEDLKESRSIALLHAAAFLEAHILEDDGIDFQTILPTLLVALQNPDQQVCQGALECISRVRILAGRKLSSVYRFDAIYGHGDSEYFNALILLVTFCQPWAFIRNVAIFGSGRPQKIPRRSR
jgi:U3 small nucleolar RNA-associated protein 10